jgi:hypothetical protein
LSIALAVALLAPAILVFMPASAPQTPAPLAPQAPASPGPDPSWTQTTWVGGQGQLAWNNTTRYYIGGNENNADDELKLAFSGTSLSYYSNCYIESSIYDAGSTVDWTTVSWDALTSSGVGPATYTYVSSYDNVKGTVENFENEKQVDGGYATLAEKKEALSAGTNLLTYPSFEGCWPGPSGWVLEGGATAAEETTIVQDGSSSCRIDTASASDKGVYQLFSVTPGDTYTETAWLRSSGTGSSGMGILLSWYLGSSLKGNTSIAYNTLPDTWEQVMVSGPVPIGADRVRVGVRGYADTASPAGYADNVAFWKGAVVYPYDMEIRENIDSIPSADNYTLEMRYKLANTNDNFHVQVWNGTAWNTRGAVLSDNNWADWSYTLLGGENIGGKVQVKFVDVNPASTSQDNLLIDYLRVRSQLPPWSTSVKVKLRTGGDNDPRDDAENWSGWCVHENNTENLILPHNRYAQYRVEMTTTDNSLTPKLHDITLNYQTPNVPPTTPTTLILNAPKVGQVLIATASGSTDAEGDSIENYYRFYNQTDGIERQAYSTTNTYIIQGIDNHDTIRVSAKAGDGHENSGERENSIIVANSLPYCRSFAPENGVTNASITPVLDWTFADNDNDTQTKYRVIFDNDSDLLSSFIDTGEVTSDTTFYQVASSLPYSTKYYWKVKVYDGYEWTDWYGIWNFATGTVPNIAPNKPTSLLPSTRQLTTNVTLSCVVMDPDGNRINVFFYEDNAAHSKIDNIWISSGGTASVAWSGRTRGVTYVFFAGGQDTGGLRGDNSDTCSFRVNSLPTTPTSLTLTGSKVDQVLTATASGSTDNDNDNITYYYRFINRTDNVERKAYSTSNTYTIQAIDAHDNIRVFAKARDGYENSGEKENSIIAVPATITITVTTDNASYDKGQMIRISGTAKDSENAPVGSGTATISIVNGSWNRTVTSAIANGAYSASYFITFDNPEGTWTISASAVDNYGSVTSAPVNVYVTVVYPRTYRYYVITFLSPTAGQTFSRGQAVTVTVQITEDNKELSGANVVLMTPRGDNVRLTEGLVGVYSTAYTLPLDDPTGDWYMTVIGEKTEGGVFKAGASLNIVGIAPATLSLTLISPTKREFEAGETVEVKVEARYSDGSPVDEGIIVVNTPGGENLSLTAEGGGIYGATYIIGGGEVGTWNIQVSAVDAYGNLGSKTVASTVIVPAGASSYVIKYWPVVLAAILGLVVASAFVARGSLRARRLGAIKGEKQEIERLRKEATLKYFKNGLISRETYDNLTKEYATKLTNLDKEERILMDKMKKKKLPEKKGR